MTSPSYNTALIVGAGSGLSASLARLFIREGLRVGLAARDAGKLAPLAAETGADTFTCDATQPDHVARLFEAATARGLDPDCSRRCCWSTWTPASPSGAPSCG